MRLMTAVSPLAVALVGLCCAAALADTLGSPGGASSAAPADLPHLASPEVKQHILDCDQLKKLVVGNTMTGTYTTDVQWAEYYDPSGEVRGVDQARGKYVGTYRLRAGNMMCFDYKGAENDWCTHISLDGSKVTLVQPSGGLDATSRDIRMVSGNPKKL